MFSKLRLIFGQAKKTICLKNNDFFLQKGKRNWAYFLVSMFRKKSSVTGIFFGVYTLQPSEIYLLELFFAVQIKRMCLFEF